MYCSHINKRTVHAVKKLIEQNWVSKLSSGKAIGGKGRLAHKTINKLLYFGNK